MNKYELKIEIKNEAYVDSILVGLARQGYAPYISEGNIYYTIYGDDFHVIEESE